MSTAIADLLGVTPGQVLDARLEGKTLLDLAAEKGVTEEQLTDALVSERKATLDQAVADGQMTQAQADWMLERMKAVAPLDLDNPFGNDGPQGGWMGGMRGGRFGGMHGDSFGGMRDDFGPRGGMRGGRFGDTDGGWFGGMRGKWGPADNETVVPTPSTSATL